MDTFNVLCEPQLGAKPNELCVAAIKGASVRPLVLVHVFIACFGCAEAFLEEAAPWFGALEGCSAV